VVLMVRAGLALVRDSGRILLEAAPRARPARHRPDLADHRGVVEVHDLHVWRDHLRLSKRCPHVIVARRSTATASAGTWRRCCGTATTDPHHAQLDHAEPTPADRRPLT
jgi:Co/Zn/Cd efflux system component